jgi:hypothetical protein
MSTADQQAWPVRRRLLVAGLVGLLAWPVVAAPAPWYYWRSKRDGQRVCAQTSPGQGWERDSEAYSKPMCGGHPRPASQSRR